MNTTRSPGSDAAEPTPAMVDPVNERTWINQVLWGLLGVSLLLALMLGLHIYTGYRVKNAMQVKLAVVDINAALDLKRTEFTRMVGREGVSDDDRGKAYDYIKQSGVEINRAMTELIAECGCIVLVKGAVINPGDSVQDLTPALMARLDRSSKAPAPKGASSD